MSEKDYLNSTEFSKDQKQEIEEGVLSGVDVTVYAKPEFLAIQMRQIRLGLEQKLPVEIYARPDYDWFQMEEIRIGLEELLNVSCYAKPEIPFDVMRQIRLGLEHGVDLSSGTRFSAGVLRQLRIAACEGIDIRSYVKKGYEEEQLKEIRIAKEKELDIDPYISLSLRGAAIHEIVLALESNLDVSLMLDGQMNWQQMREIRLGLEHRVDVKYYQKPLYSWQQMYEIRRGLEENLPVDTYSSLMYTANEMKKKRQKLEKARKNAVESKPEQKKEYGEFALLIDSQQMEAFILVPKLEMPIKKKKLLDALKEKGVVYGIDQEAILELDEKGASKNMVVIARGKKAEPGKDGWYEYFFDTNLKKTPKVLEDGSVDYQNVKWFEIVEKDQRVAYYHSAETGVSGRKVTGEEVPAFKGKELPPLRGKGIALLPDQKTYVAGTSGKIVLRGGNLIVTNVLVVENVTKATGNVDFNGSVYVRGMLGDGVVVKAAGDVMVDGFIEAAIIEAGGDIILKKGNNAGGKGYMKAGRDVMGNFFENVHIEAGGDIKANYCLNSEIKADGSVQITGRNGRLAGGSIEAGRGVMTYDLGNPAGIATNVKVGREQGYFKRKDALLQKIEEDEKELGLLKNAYQDFQKKFPPEIRNTNEIYLKLEDAIYTKGNDVKELKEKLEQLEDEVANGKTAKVVVSGKVYQGVSVYIDDVKWRSTEARNVTIRKIDDMVVLYKN